jgi:hypothetical protein
MKRDDGQQGNADRPEKFDIGLEKMAVTIDGLRAEENLEVARQVADDKQETSPPRCPP